MNRTLVLSIALFCLLATSGTASAQSPIGFERSTVSSVNSGVDFGLTQVEVFQKYAAQLGLPGGPPPVHGQKNKRLIDIEIRGEGTGLANYVYDVVWIDNTDDFRLESWFVPDLTERDVKSLQSFRDAVILDIERYPRGRQWRFSVILQRNPGQFPWQVMIDADLADIMASVSATGSRLVDIDAAGSFCNPRSPTGQACGDAIVDAVMVQNSGTNYLPTANGLLLATDLYPLIVAGDYQLVDHEFVGGEYYLTIWVQSGHKFEDIYDQTDNDVVINHNGIGRVVDLEGIVVDLPGIATGMSYYTINLAHSN